MMSQRHSQGSHHGAESDTIRGSSLELARGAEVRELSLREVSNLHLEELVRMRQSWTRLAAFEPTY